MSQNADPLTLALTGQLPFVILVASVVAFPCSLLLLWLYRRAVLRTMGRRSHVRGEGNRNTLHTGSHAAPTVGVGLKLRVEETGRVLKSPIYTCAQHGAWRAALIYGFAGVVFTLVMVMAVLVSGNMEVSVVRYLMVFWVYAWPVVLTVNFIAASTRRVMLMTGFIYFVILLLITSVAVARSTQLTLNQIVMLWTITNLPPTVLLFAFLARRIRAVGPMVLTFMVISATGSVIALAVAGANAGLLRIISNVGSSIGLSASATFIGIVIGGFLMFAGVGWLAVTWIRWGYQSKKLSDQSITLDALWVLFAISQSIGLVFEAPLWVLSGLAAFIAYKMTVWIGFRTVQAQQNSKTFNARLLLLRVFSLGKRSERLFDAITKRWRYAGSVQLIAGPDLATTTVEPQEFLEFLSGRISRLFIDGKAMLDSRMLQLDVKPDFDSRYRVNDFFCYDDTWEMVLSRLVEESDVVFMDLRGFSPQNAGCVRELTELINVVPLERVVLAIDDTTDYGFLENTITNAWDQVSADSPNIESSEVELRLFRLSRLGTQHIAGLVSALSSAVQGKDSPL